MNLKKILLGNGVEFLNETQMKSTRGGDIEMVCVWVCTCVRGDGSLYSIRDRCSNAPWDRSSECDSGYQNCGNSMFAGYWYY